MRRMTGFTQWFAWIVVIVSAQGCGRAEQAANPGEPQGVAQQISTADVGKTEQPGLPEWKQYAECGAEAKRGGQSDARLHVCINDTSVSIDGPALLHFLTRYACAEQPTRTAMK